MQSASPRLIKLTKCSIVFGIIMLIYVTTFEDETHVPKKRLVNVVDNYAGSKNTQIQGKVALV